MTNTTVPPGWLGPLLQEARERSGHTVASLVRTLGVYRADIERIEAGLSVPSAEGMTRLLDVLGVRGPLRDSVLAVCPPDVPAPPA